GPEATDGQVLLVFAGAVEPAVVGDVDQEISPLLAGSDVAPGELGVGVLVTDQDAEVMGADGQTRLLPAGGDAVVVVVRGKAIHEGEDVAQRDELAEGYPMDLVVATDLFAAGADEQGGVIAQARRMAISIEVGRVKAEQNGRRMAAM